MLDIKITRTTSPKEKPDENNLGFGKKFTDHMFVMDYTEGEGWHDARIVPYGPFELDPATVVFHYAQEIFEGMKAYRTADDTVQLFRPDCNAKRFRILPTVCASPRSPWRITFRLLRLWWMWTVTGCPTPMVLPCTSVPSFLQTTWVWVCTLPSTIFLHHLPPSGRLTMPMFQNPLPLRYLFGYIRAAPGLTGFTKCGGNYATSIKAGELAEEQGYAQVLWLDGVEKKYVEEVGSMNIMFKIGGKDYSLLPSAPFCPVFSAPASSSC